MIELFMVTSCNSQIRIDIPLSRAWAKAIYPRYIASEAIVAYVRAKKASMNSSNFLIKNCNKTGQQHKSRLCL